jgi:hypothetical protein
MAIYCSRRAVHYRAPLHLQRRLFKAALDELAVVGDPVNRVLEVDLDGVEATLTPCNWPPAGS